MIYKIKCLVPLEELCDIRFGFQALPSESGRIPYIQIRHFNETGQLSLTTSEMIDLDEKSKSHLLLGGDVLFVGKGSRLFAWEYDAVLGSCIASSTFFVLRVNKTKILPSYLTTLLNAPQFNSHLQQLGSGTNIFSIRKSELGAVKIPIPPIEQQHKIVAIASAHQQSIRLAQQVLDKKNLLYKGVLSSLLKKDI